MAYLVRRPDGRIEIRETHRTPAGPRARTLASGSVLSDALIAKAAARAARPFDREAIERKARVLSIRRGRADDSADALLASLRRGEQLPLATRTALQRALGRRRRLDPSVASVLDWVGVADADRGRALQQLLQLTDRIPHRPRRDDLRFPPIGA